MIFVMLLSAILIRVQFIASLESAAPDFIKSVVTTTKDGSISTVK